MKLFSWLPSRAAMGAAIVAVIAAVFAGFGRYVRKNTRQELELKDHENADKIEDRVAAGRADFDNGVRPYANSGWRDDEQTGTD